MRVAAYQAPLLPFGSFEVVDRLGEQLRACVRSGAELLVCPEAVVGGLAHESDGQSPTEVALSPSDLLGRLRPVLPAPIPVVIGFTERTPDESIFNSAAIVVGHDLVGVYRKVFPGYRTIVRPGTELPVFDIGTTSIGVTICNDTWYVEPARVLAERGAAILCVPVNGAHAAEKYRELEARGRSLLVARAVETTTALVAADVAGRLDGRISAGTTAIIDPDGTVLASATPYEEDLVMADVPATRRPPTPRGRDGWTNPAVTDAFLQLWETPRP